jgi:hypothetical protein
MKTLADVVNDLACLDGEGVLVVAPNRRIADQIRHKTEVVEKLDPSTVTRLEDLPFSIRAVVVDGDHRLAAVKRDVKAAISLAQVVVLHDCLPANEAEGATEKPAGGKPWCGEVWKVFLICRRAGFDATLLPFDHGVGVIWSDVECPGRTEIPPKPRLKAYLENWREWAGVVDEPISRLARPGGE